MLKEYQQIRTLNIVLLGEFNPAIIQPFWLAKKGLIKEQEALEAKLEIVNPQLTRYDLDWVFIELTANRFTFNSSKEPFFALVKDLVEGIFSFLPETPITAIGINHLIHYSIPRDEQFYEIGNRLTPLTMWDNILKDPKMLEYSIIEQKRTDKNAGSFLIKIQASDQILKNGLLISVNDHLALKPDQNGRSGELIQLMKQTWTSSFKRTDESILQLWSNLKL
jgi:hypothetical protein